jgi:hypothetical protein
MDIADAIPRQLASSVGNLGAGVRNSAAPSSPSNNSTIAGGQICFGYFDFLHGDFLLKNRAAGFGMRIPSFFQRL